MPTAFGKIRRGETLHVWGDGSAVRDYLYIDDLVGLCTAALTRQMPSGVRIVNACSGIGISLNELFTAMEEVTGQPLRRSYEHGRVLDSPCVTMDGALARYSFGDILATPLHEGPKRTWAWLNSTPR